MLSISAADEESTANGAGSSAKGCRVRRLAPACSTAPLSRCCSTLATSPRGERLEHLRVLDESFDFLTRCQYLRQDAPAFEELVCPLSLVSRLRATPEWDYVGREIDICLAR